MQAVTPASGSTDTSHVGLPELESSFPWYAPIKVVLDTALAVLLLVLLAPVILLLMILVKCTSPGPALYCQVRLGRHRQPFTLYKIRTMSHGCEQHTGPRWASLDDPRATPLGRFLRRSHLDELPQLWNVIRGEMSLVGPRPERPEFVHQLERVVPEYQCRIAIRPGVTGLAQIQLPPDTDLQSVHRKVTCDLYYIRNMNLIMDLQIVLATATKIFGMPTHISCNVLGVPTESAIRAARGLQGPKGGTDSRCLAEPA
jgi:lipopolysaccharide/colanic/teichoic acid biosynthesis glycosyltransferase